MTKEEKREMYKPHKWKLYENGEYINTYDSHNEAKKAMHQKMVDARLDWLDLDYEIRRVD